MFKRSHGCKTVNDIVYLTDQADNVAQICPLDGKFHTQLGTLYVSDCGNRRVWIFTPDGQFKGQWTGMGGSNEMALDKNGILYLDEQATETSKAAISVRNGNAAALARW